MYSNIQLAKQTISALFKKGVREFVVCAGARNAPLVKVLSSLSDLSQSPIQVYYFFEERSAAFFALGRIKSKAAPVAVVTTSGTAVAELYPAVIEAYYSGLPLVLVTADRPKKFRHKGAPQSIEQVGIFSQYVHPDNATDWDDSTQNFQLNLSADSATQLNVCFKEPLIDDDLSVEPNGLSLLSPIESVKDFSSGLSEATLSSSEIQLIEAFAQKSKNPLVVLSELPSESEDLVDFLVELNQPIYIEAHSGLREHKKLAGLRIQSGDRFLSSAVATNYFDGVLRIGSIPTVRLWRDLEDRLSNWPVLSFSHRHFSGLSREANAAISYGPHFSNVRHFVYEFLKKASNLKSDHDSFMSHDSESYFKLKNLFLKYPQAEPTFVHALSESFGSQSVRLFLGNSLPIREWDLAASYEPASSIQVAGNRGVNGIDGLVSTFLGWADSAKQNILLLGDLSALYDLAGLWPYTQGYCPTVQIVVINNSGGKIFQPMFKDKNFENHHELNFSSWAEMFHLEYRCVRDSSELKNLFSQVPKQSQIIEIQPQNEQSQNFWREL